MAGNKDKIVKPKKVYRNSGGKVIYKQSSDKVGDTLENRAGVKYKIIGERFQAPTGRNDDGVQIRILTIAPDKKTGLTPYEISDTELEHIRKHGIFLRLKRNGKLSNNAKTVINKQNRESKKFTRKAVKEARKARKESGARTSSATKGKRKR